MRQTINDNSKEMMGVSKIQFEQHIENIHEN